MTHLLASLGVLNDLRAYVRAHPALIYARDADGWTLLHEAVAHNHVGVVEYLIDQGAEVNVQTYRGASSLYLAQHRYGDDSPISQVLVGYGAIRTEPSLLSLRKGGQATEPRHEGL
ncbi:MAG: hypothetical protein SGILL_008187 [Bacillariaceae sp.]